MGQRNVFLPLFVMLFSSAELATMPVDLQRHKDARVPLNRSGWRSEKGFRKFINLYWAQSEQAKRERLIELLNDYLFRDIIAFEGIRNSDKIRKLLTLIAFQPGKEVSLSD